MHPTFVARPVTHWADVTASELMDKHQGGKQVFATAITPSGPIHVGNMREVLTTEAIFRAVRDAGGDAELLYIADDYDPLRKVYPFLEDHPDIDYAKHIGKPLREVPCPCGEHPHYAAHFLEPFLGNLEHLGIRPTVLSAYDMYHEGRYVEATIAAMTQMPLVREIIEQVTKRQLPKRWVPFNPQCSQCRTIKGVEVIRYDHPIIEYECGCGHKGQHDITQPGVGKLPWRLDWPARWGFLGVTFEAFGKDHGAAGGSWDSGIRLAREVFGAQEPHHVMYEFLNLKGQGAMHSSTGLAISADELLRMTPPEVLRYLLMRQSPRKHIDFDPGLGLLSLVDEFDRFERIYFGAEENPGTFTELRRTYQLSCPADVPPALPVKAPFKHLVTVVQMASTVEEIANILERSGELAAGADMDLLAERVEHVRYWLGRFAPDQVRFEVQQELPSLAINAEGKAFLATLAEALSRSKWTGQAIHDTIYEAKGDMGPGEAFRPIYQAILGQDRGPRAGFFLSSLEKDWVLERLRAASV